MFQFSDIYWVWHSISHPFPSPSSHGIKFLAISRPWILVIKQHMELEINCLQPREWERSKSLSLTDTHSLTHTHTHMQTHSLSLVTKPSVWICLCAFRRRTQTDADAGHVTSASKDPVPVTVIDRFYYPWQGNDRMNTGTLFWCSGVVMLWMLWCVLWCDSRRLSLSVHSVVFPSIQEVTITRHRFDSILCNTSVRQ